MGGFGDFRPIVTPPLVPHIHFDLDPPYLAYSYSHWILETAEGESIPDRMCWRCCSDEIIVLEVDVTRQRAPQ